MPHLDLTYFFNQSFWCIVVFFLIYLTLSNNFFSQYSRIFQNREDVVLDYVKRSQTFLEDSRYIEERIKKLQRTLSIQVKKQEEYCRDKISIIRYEEFVNVKKNIENKKLSYKCTLNVLQDHMTRDLFQYSYIVRDNVNSYLFQK